MAALKDLAAAMTRDRITFRWLPLMVDQAQLQAAAASIAARQTASQQQEADRQRAAADQQRVAAARASEASAVRARAQEELRRQYGAMARAFETSLTTEMKSFLEAAAGLAPSTPTTAIFAQKYPEIVKWYAEQLSERWELVSVETVLVDYGIAEFKGRSLETAFAQHQIRLRNRILGEYKQQCFVTAFIADNEFSMDREPMAATCAEGAATSDLYRTAQRFSSRWIAP
jgi:multidrug efflux pump subunit AcrA (membrane-fusion protein)